MATVILPNGALTHIVHQWTIYANLQELQNLPESESYLFHNYKWVKHPAFENIVECVFSEADYNNAAGFYHELWKNHLPSLKRNWC